MIFYVNLEILICEFLRLYVYVYYKGFKFLYYICNKLLSVEECISCVI